MLKKINRAGRANMFLFIVIIFVLLVITALPVGAQDGGTGVRRGVHRQTGMTNFIAADPQRPISVPAAETQGLDEDDYADVLLERFGPEFGLKNPSRELEQIALDQRRDGGTTRRYQQTYHGVPVLAGQLILNSDDQGRLLSLNGEVSPLLDIETQASISEAEATDAALGAIAKQYGLPADELSADDPELWIFDERLLLPSSRPVELVWRMDVNSTERLEIDELVLVNAHTGGISLRFNQVDTALNRSTYDAENGTVLPGVLRCNEGNPTCSGGDSHEVAAHLHAGDTYNFYLTHHGRDSMNDAGMAIVSTVHFGVDYANAFWSGSYQQMVYGDYFGFPLGDDVVAHELTHGVTDYSSNLFYYYQSGAINESLSDLWGEFVDLTNGRGNDSSGVRWLMGEDITGVGAIRDMSDPTIYGDPDKMTSPNYYTGSSDYDSFGDNGGVHTNSGVNNKAVYLMVDGGSFNGRTIDPLGIDKVAAIYYEVQTGLLTTGADYLDLYQALYQACQMLVGGSDGITSGDCVEVRQATEAVEMNLEPVPGYNPEVALCPSDRAPLTYFFDGFEAGGGNWITGLEQGSVIPWIVASGYAAEGQNMLWGSDEYLSTDSWVSMNLDIPVEARLSTFLHFEHAFGFEDGQWDGGWLEYSTDGGSTWTDADGLLHSGQGYNGTLQPSNPNSGQAAFVNNSHGYLHSRYNISALAGNSVRFRWRMSTDSIIYDWGWFIDNVHIYMCAYPLYLPLIQR